MKTPSILPALFLAPVLLTVSAAAVAQRHAQGPGRPPAQQVSTAGKTQDPFVPVYVVTSRDTYRQQLQSMARNPASRRDSAGRQLVISQLQAQQLPELSERIHRDENRCGGFFAFDTRAAAESFIRSDRTAQVVAAAPLLAYTIDNQVTVDPWLPEVDASAIKATIARLSAYRNRYYTSSYGKAAAESIRDDWQQLAAGRGDVDVELFTACGNCSTQPSVILTIQGNELPDEIVVLGAHLDSIISGAGGSTEQLAPGADDDASGIATLTEVLRIAMADGWKPQRTIKFMGYAAEEVGLRGSNAIAQSFQADGKNVVGVLQLDMTNYKMGTGADMQVITDYSSNVLKQFLADLFDDYLVPLGFTRGTYTCGYGCSDHASWTSAGYPSAMMFEAGDQNGNYFPYIHSSDDTLANMGDSADNSAKFAKFGLAFLGELGKSTDERYGDTDGGVLTRAVAIGGVSKAAGSVTFHMDVPEGAVNLVFTLFGGTGNADLSISLDGEPIDAAFHCRSLRSGNLEQCQLAMPRPGAYDVMLKANPSFDDVSLKGDYRTRL